MRLTFKEIKDEISKIVPRNIDYSVDLEAGSSSLYFDQPQYGVSTGQAAVIYNPEDEAHVLGGGWITKAPNMFS